MCWFATMSTSSGHACAVLLLPRSPGPSKQKPASKSQLNTPCCHVDVVAVVVRSAQVVRAHRLRTAAVHTHPAMQTAGGRKRSQNDHSKHWQGQHVDNRGQYTWSGHTAWGLPRSTPILQCTYRRAWQA
jgi:hypothetical protein